MDRELGECGAISGAEKGHRGHVLWMTVRWNGHADVLAEPDTCRRPDSTRAQRAQSGPQPFYRPQARRVKRGVAMAQPALLSLKKRATTAAIGAGASMCR